MPEYSRLLLSAFTAFGRFAANPSAVLAERLGLPHRLLEVSYIAVDEFVNGLNPAAFDLALCLGVAGNSSGFRLETLARNRFDPIADVRGHVPADGVIDPTAPPALPGTLWPADLLANPPRGVVASDDAGGYLCNYLYFRMLQRFPMKRIGFLHVPPLEKMRLEEQANIARQMIQDVLNWVN